MSYEGRGAAELQTFCKARGLPTKAITASRLARALEKADDLITFPRFFDLPAEIRNIIYELFFNALNSFESKHVQPPLTLASSQLRSEALPVFYDCATFNLRATCRMHRYNMQQHESNILHSTSLIYTPAANFKRMKNIDLHWENSETHEEIKIAVRLIATHEPEHPDPSLCPLHYAPEQALELKFGTFKQAREMQKASDLPLTMSIRGELLNATTDRSSRLGLLDGIGSLAIRNCDCN
jgi:hypothetical protein